MNSEPYLVLKSYLQRLKKREAWLKENPDKASTKQLEWVSHNIKQLEVVASYIQELERQESEYSAIVKLLEEELAYYEVLYRQTADENHKLRQELQPPAEVQRKRKEYLQQMQEAESRPAFLMRNPEAAKFIYGKDTNYNGTE